jgi:sugar O-acyltransferase (sialic acid O-acetyltransferase NeuD family)
MSKRLVIFGLGDIAELAHYYFTKHTSYNVVGFTVDREYAKEAAFLGLPVLPFDEVSGVFPPGDYRMFIALAYSKLNAIRKEKYLAAKKIGYELASYISPHATVLTDKGFGDNCFILEDNTIQPFTTIGNNVTLWSGNHLGHHSTIKDHTFVASHVVISGGVEIGEQCFLGVNATLRDHVTISDRCIIGAGALILGNTDEDGVYIGTKTERSAVHSSTLRKI